MEHAILISFFTWATVLLTRYEEQGSIHNKGNFIPVLCYVPSLVSYSRISNIVQISDNFLNVSCFSIALHLIIH